MIRLAILLCTVTLLAACSGSETPTPAAQRATFTIPSTPEDIGTQTREEGMYVTRDELCAILKRVFVRAGITDERIGTLAWAYNSPSQTCDQLWASLE